MASPPRNAMMTTPITAGFLSGASGAASVTERRHDDEVALHRLAFDVAGQVGGTDRDDVVAGGSALDGERRGAGLPLGLVDFADEGRARRVFRDVLEAEDDLVLARLHARAHRDPG